MSVYCPTQLKCIHHIYFELKGISSIKHPFFFMEFYMPNVYFNYLFEEILVVL